MNTNQHRSACPAKWSKVEQSGRHKTMMIFNWMEIIIIMLSPQVCIYWSELKHRIGCSYQLPLTP